MPEIGLFPFVKRSTRTVPGSHRAASGDAGFESVVDLRHSIRG